MPAEKGDKEHCLRQGAEIAFDLMSAQDAIAEMLKNSPLGTEPAAFDLLRELQPKIESAMECQEDQRFNRLTNAKLHVERAETDLNNNEKQSALVEVGYAITVMISTEY